jgi:hypothetical protein
VVFVYVQQPTKKDHQKNVLRFLKDLQKRKKVTETMIIETPYKPLDTITVKTTAGEEVVCRFLEENDKTITIQKPLALMPTAQGIGLGPFAFTLNPDAKIKLNKTAILFVHKTDAEMAKQYVTSTSSLQMA